MKNMIFFAKRLIASALVVGSVAIATPALADTQIEAFPSAWLLQDYLNGDITLFYTGSTCANGALILSGSAPAESRARLWSMLLTAIGTNRKVGINYNNNGGCYITNFYLLPS